MLVQKCNFDQKKTPAAARRYNNKGFKQKKAPAAGRRYKNKGFSAKNTDLKNISKTGRNELKMSFSHYLGASENDFDNEMPPNT